MNRSRAHWRSSIVRIILVGTIVLGWSSVALPSGIPGPVRLAIPDARLAGEGEFRWFGLKIYHAKLWVGKQGFRPDRPNGAMFALDLHYARALYGARIAQSSIDEMQKLGAGNPDQHRAWLAAMEKIFPDVQDGNRITGVHLPDTGAIFYLDGAPLGEVRDPEFGRAFFAIWLDPRTSAPDLRRALLQDSAPKP